MTSSRETNEQFGLRFAPDRPKNWAEIRHNQKDKARIANLGRIKSILDSGTKILKIDGQKVVAPLTVGQEARLERQYFFLRRFRPTSDFPVRQVTLVVENIYPQLQSPSNAIFADAVRLVRTAKKQIPPLPSST